VGNVHESDTEAENKSTKSGGPYEEPIEGVDNAKAHDGDYMAAQDDRDTDTTTMLHMKPISSSTPMSQDHYTSHSNSVCSYPDPSSMEATCPPTTRNVDHVYANMPRVDTTTLLDKDVHLKEMPVAQLDLILQQAAMDKNQSSQELTELKNRIMWLEDRALEQQVGPTETSSTTTSSQRHQRVFPQPLRQDPKNIMIPSLHPVLSQQNVWETWNRSRHKQLHQTTPSANVNMILMLMRTHKVDTKVQGGAS
jgi:hypothetical protein